MELATKTANFEAEWMVPLKLNLYPIRMQSPYLAAKKATPDEDRTAIFNEYAAIAEFMEGSNCVIAK